VSRAPAAAPVGDVLAFLGREYPGARVLLAFRNPFELLVATVLAAQCTDERVNRVTPGLFRAYPAPHPSRRFRRESWRRPSAHRLLPEQGESGPGSVRGDRSRHGGRVPETMEELTALPGVGRKTASILLGACFGIPALPVDTHVARVSFRLGLTRSKDPVRIEEDLAVAVRGGSGGSSRPDSAGTAGRSASRASPVR